MRKVLCTLLVDDDAITNYVNQLLLEELDVTEQVLIAHNGREALELIQQQCAEDCCPELILLDINMPVMNGFEFLEAYRKLEWRDRQPGAVFMLTTSTHPLDIERLKTLPIQGYLTKPLTREAVDSLVKTIFS